MEDRLREDILQEASRFLKVNSSCVFFSLDGLILLVALFDGHCFLVYIFQFKLNRYGNKILVTDELPDGQMVDQWEPVTQESVITPLEV